MRILLEKRMDWCGVKRSQDGVGLERVGYIDKEIGCKDGDGENKGVGKGTRQTFQSRSSLNYHLIIFYYQNICFPLLKYKVF